MLAHLRANLLILGLTLGIGAVLYPLLILLVGQGLFPDKADGSLLKDGDRVIGSRLLAQEFKQPRYFWPRPSSTGYNAAESGGSNLGSDNPQLRDRVARQLGPMIIARNGKRVGPEVEAWVHSVTKAPLLFWVEKNPKLADAWLGVKDNEEAVDRWVKDNAAALPGQYKDRAPKEIFFEAFASRNPGAFFDVQDKKIVPVSRGDVIEGAFFDLWLQQHPERARELNPVPADQVMTSGSGLDPHITLANARSQTPRVIDAWAQGHNIPVERVGETVEKGIQELAFGPLPGTERIVNVLELNHYLEHQLNPAGNNHR